MLNFWGLLKVGLPRILVKRAEWMCKNCMVDKKVDVYRLDRLIIQIDDQRDDGNLESVEKSVTESARCNNLCVIDGWPSSFIVTHFNDTLSGWSVSLIRHIIIWNWNNLDVCTYLATLCSQPVLNVDSSADRLVCLEEYGRKTSAFVL